MNNLANSYQLAGRLADALPLYEEGLVRSRAKMGPDHLDTLIALNNLAMAYQNAGRLIEALPLFLESLDARRARMGPDHPATFVAMNNLALAYQQAGRLGEAIPLLEEALKGRRARLDPAHPDTLLSMDNLARAYLSGRPAEAERLRANAWRSASGRPRTTGRPSRPAACSAAAFWAGRRSPRPSRSSCGVTRA